MPRQPRHKRVARYGTDYHSDYSAGIVSSQPVLYLLHVVRSAVQGMGNTLLPMVSGIGEFVMRTGCVLLLPALLGEDGIYIAEIAAWLGADLVLVPSYFITMKKARSRLGGSL